ncbi:MAG: hypothetical protein AAGJ38_00440 [Planctomycetota bacterium]
MPFLEQFKTKPQWAIAASLIALALSLWLISRSMGSADLNENKWMFDLNTQRIVIAPRTTLSPASDLGTTFDYPGISTSGSVVDAVLYSCGDPGRIKDGTSLKELEERGVYIGYLARYPESVIKLLASGEPMDEAPAQLISDASGQRWVPMQSHEAAVILDPISSLCGGDVPFTPRP